MGDADANLTESADEQVQGLPSGFGPSGRAGDPPVQRVRLTFTKGRSLRFIGHLDLVRMWERAFRRSQLPLAYTLGYTPHPRLAFAAPLALGATGGAELVDVYLRERLSPDELVKRISAELPSGCEIRDAEDVDLAGPQLMALTRWAEYRAEAAAALPIHLQEVTSAVETAQGSRWGPVTSGARSDTGAHADAPLPDQLPWRPDSQRVIPLPRMLPLPALADLRDRIERLLASPEIRRQRRREGKTLEYDLRPLILYLWIADYDDDAEAPAITLGMVLKADSSGSGRPEEVAAALGLRARLIHRVRIGLEGSPLEDEPSRRS